jgi:hypothetical protein
MDTHTIILADVAVEEAEEVVVEEAEEVTAVLHEEVGFLPREGMNDL